MGGGGVGGLGFLIEQPIKVLVVLLLNILKFVNRGMSVDIYYI